MNDDPRFFWEPPEGGCVSSPMVNPSEPDLEFGKQLVIALPKEVQQSLYEWMHNVLGLKMP